MMLPDDPLFWFKFERVDRQVLKHGRSSYVSRSVDKVLLEIGQFVYGDVRSE